MKTMTHLHSLLKLGKRGKLENGVAAIEFALLLIPLLLIVAGVIEFGRTFWYYDALTKATRDGARLMSMADKDTITSTKVAANDMVVAAANNAKVSPALASGNVSVECLNASYAVQTCVNGTAPANVRVTIVDFNVTIGDWIPFITPTGTTTWGATLSPSTTMRYLCSSTGPC